MFGNAKKVSVTAIYQVKDNSLMSGELRQATVEADSLHKGEVEQALADKHETDYRNVTAIKWGES